MRNKNPGPVPIRLVFFGHEYVIESFMLNLNMFSRSPEHVLMRLEAMLESGEITKHQLEEMIKMKT